ncbi:MAG: hypothetical protein Q7U47_13875 [Paludibacter sp.]|nr:hypothetical protein [Paludibacter sp.]
MKQLFLFILLIVFTLSTLAQNKSTTDSRPLVVKPESNWNKQENENNQNQQITTADGISFSTNSEGIFITLPTASNSIKLFALTGEIVWSGDLVQGRFFIPTRKGIYFLRINNKSYKVVCK